MKATNGLIIKLENQKFMLKSNFLFHYSQVNVLPVLQKIQPNYYFLNHFHHTMNIICNKFTLILFGCFHLDLNDEPGMGAAN